MYVACFVGPGPGHLDFGGSGFLKLAQELRSRGHVVHWFAASQHRERLVSEGFAVTCDKSVAFLRLSPLFSPDKIETDIENYRVRITALRRLYAVLCERPPDLMIMDRVLAIGQLVADQLDIPTAVVGTNGGYWMRDGLQAVMSTKPNPAYQEVGDRIKRDLNWSKGSLESFWARSPQANISFLGRNYYGEAIARRGNGLHVHHFTSPAPAIEKRAYGISFGNSGDAALMTRVLACLRTSNSAGYPLEIFAGNHRRLFQLISAEGRRDERVHEWVDFSDYMPRLKSLAFFGGIGTVWHCINYQVPMLVIPGGIGDQQFNARRISELGLGESLPAEDVDCQRLETVLSRLTDDESYLRNISQFKDMHNYTDTLITVVDKLEGFQ
jgi:hypothetical protein